MKHERFNSALALAVLAFTLATTGCGGSDDPAPEPPPTQTTPPDLPAGSATVGGAAQTAAVTIQGVGGASVVVPPGAAAQPVTLRIAADATGAPALPADLVARGPMLAITPHDVSFAEPVRVRIPAPALTLAEGERLVLAKASPQGEWVVMADTQLLDGMLELEVSSFSFFLPVVIQVGTANLQPWSATLNIQCGAQDCQRLVGPVDVAVSLTSNQGVLPAGCTANSRVTVETRSRRTVSGNLSPYPFDFTLPIAGGTTSRRWNASTTGMYAGEISATLRCPGLSPRQIGYRTLRWQRVYSFQVDVLPVALAVGTLTHGAPAVATATLTGGGQDGIEGFSAQPYPVAPTPANQATVDWERSDDDGASWRIVARSYQSMATATPFGSNAAPWDYWTVRHEFGTEGNRSGRILFRVHACVDARKSLDAGRTITTERRCRFGGSQAATVLAAATPPVFTQLPRALMVLNGQTASFSASATGLPAPTVSWQTRPANSPGAWTDVGVATGAATGTFTTPLLTLADNGTQYRAVATSSAGTELSPPVTVSVSDAPVAPRITAEPSAVRTVRGGDATVAVAVRGTEPLSYQWRVNGSVVVGENAPLITLQGVLGTTPVSVTVSNGAGSVTSREVSVTAFDGPIPTAPVSILLQPVATMVGAGNTATLAVRASGGGDIGYRWQRNGVDLVGAADAPILSWPSASASDAGNYRVVVSNSVGSVTSNEVALVVSAGGVAADPLSITVQPVGLSLNTGQTATLAVAARGAGTLRYQWLREGVALAGATAPVLTISAVAPGDAGNYTVQVSDSGGSRLSSAAGLVVVPAPGAPQLTTAVQPLDAVEGDTPRVQLAVVGTPAPQCLWLRNGGLIAGATDCTGYTLPAVTLADSGSVYTAVAYNGAGAVVAGPTLLTVRRAVAPSISTPPADQSTTAGGSAVFTAVVSGTPAPLLTWQFNGTSLFFVATGGGYINGSCSFDYGRQDTISGSASTTSTTLSLSNVAAGCTGATLTLIATDNTSTATAAATLTVNPAVPTNALTATQIVAGHEWNVVLRPDRTVWAWGGLHRNDGTVQIANLAPANVALRPQRMYPGVLNDVHAIAGWYDGFWALKGTPGSTGSRVLHWGNARDGVDGRGTDGAGGGSGTLPQFRYNESTPVEVLERLGGVARPVDRVCSIAGGTGRLLMIRAISPAGASTDCNPGSAKTVWMVGSLTPLLSQSTGIAFAMPGLPTDSPPALIFFGATSSGAPPLVVTLEDGRLYAAGDNPYNGLGMPLPLPGSGRVGDANGPQLLPAAWGAPQGLGMSFYYSLFVLRSDGSVLSSGYNGADELGLGALASGTQVSGPAALLAETCSSNACTSTLSGVTALVSNNNLNTLALKGGQILGWGSGANGLLGPGVAGNQTQPYPRVVPAAVSGFSALSSAHGHALALGPGNVVYAWGNGLRGALGDGVDGSQRSAPERVTTP